MGDYGYPIPLDKVDDLIAELKSYGFDDNQMYIYFHQIESLDEVEDGVKNLIDAYRRQGYSDEDLSKMFLFDVSIVPKELPIDRGNPFADHGTEWEERFNKWYNYYVEADGGNEYAAFDDAFNACNNELEFYKNVSDIPPNERIDPMPTSETVTEPGGEPGPTVAPVVPATQELAPGYSISKLLEKSDNPLGNQDVNNMSRLDFIAIYSTSNKLTSNELRDLIKKLDSSDMVFTPHPTHYFFGTAYEEKYNLLANSGDARSKANALSEEVRLLKQEFQRSQKAFDNWKGSASDSERESVETLLKEFDGLIKTLESTVKPTCNLINNLTKKLENLKKGEQKLFQLTGVDGNGSVIGNQQKDCLYLLKKQQEELQADYDSCSSNYNSISNNPEYGDNGKTTNSYNNSLRDAKNKLTNAENKLNKINKDIENKEKQIEKQRSELDKMLEDVILTIYDIEQFDLGIESVESYLGFDPGDKGQPNEHFGDWDQFKEHILENNENIINGVRYDQIPVESQPTASNDTSVTGKEDVYTEFENMLTG